MRGIVCALPGAEVAAGVAAIRRLGGKRVISPDVALGAGGHFSSRGQLVRVGQRESSRTVIKFSVRPHGDRVARRASGCTGREIRGNVVRHVSANRLRGIPRRLMASHAIGGG